MATSAWGGSWGESPNSSWGDSWGFEGFVAPDTAPVIPPGGGRGVDYLSWWEREWARIREERKARKKKKVPKKKRDVLEELDEILVELKSRVREEEVPQRTQVSIGEIQAFANDALSASVTIEQIRIYVSLANAIAQEMDDEETILLALH